MRLKTHLALASLLLLPLLQPMFAGAQENRILPICRQVAKWQLANPSQLTEHGPTEWTQATLYAGLMALYEASGEDEFRQVLLAMGKANGWKAGPRSHFADDQAVCQTYIDLAMNLKEPAFLAPTREQFDAIIAHPSQRDLQWPAKGTPKSEFEAWGRRWSWCDALFMAPPAWAKLYKATGDRRYLDFLDQEYWTTVEYLFDPQACLFYRDSRFFTAQTPHGQKMFWSRGNGWVLAGLARVLECLPEKWPSRPRYEKLFTDMAAAIARCQQEDGLWRPSLADPLHIPHGETSGSAFFCYGLAWGINQGLLNKAAYLPVVDKAWAALVAKVHPDGKLGGVQPIGGAPDKVTDDSTEVYGVGAFLLAGKQMLILHPDAPRTPTPEKKLTSEAPPLSAAQMDRLRQLAADDFLRSADLQARRFLAPEAQTAEHLQKLLETAAPDGSRPDIDYRSTPRQNWPALGHFDHLQDLVIAWKTPGSPLAGNPAAKTRILQAIDYWLEKDFQNPNWWYGHIGIPAYGLGPVLLVMHPELTAEQIRKGCAILARCDLKTHARWRTGGNLIFDCRAALHYGLLAQDPELVSRIYSRMIYGECHTTGPIGSGIKEDWSEWEHGNLLFSHGYGSLLVAEAARLLSFAREVGIPLQEPAIAFMTDFLLEGSQWMARGSFLDPSARGRGIVTPETEVPDMQRHYMVLGARYLARLNPQRKAELEALSQRLGGEAPALSGNRAFFVSDFMSHSRPAFYASVRMFSSRTINTEICNGQNRLGHHLGEGTTYLVARGDEYRNLFPVWDWLKVPGTTVNASSLSDANLDEVVDSGWFPSTDPEEEGFGRGRLRVSRRGRTNFVGSASDGQVGVACMDLKVLGLSAKKAWFFLDDGVMCLGAGISDTQRGNVMTTLNQCRKATPVTLLDREGRQQQLPVGTYSLSGVRLVQHDQFAYLFPEASTGLWCANQTARGDWKRVDVNQSDAPVEKELFTLWLEHGEKPEQASYAYRVLAESELSRSRAALERHEVEILSNTTRLQAIRDRRRNVVMAVFHSAGLLEVDAMSLRVAEPCVVILEPSKLLVCDPSCGKKTLNINLNGQMYFARVADGKTTALQL